MSIASTSSASGRIATVAADVWHAPLAFGLRHALHAVRPRLELQPREHAVARESHDDLAVAALLAGALR